MVPPELVRTIEDRFGAHFAVAYGQTETLGNVTQTQLDDSPEDKAETIGQPLPQTEVKIIAIGKDISEVQPVGEPGELCVRGPMMMKSYCNAPDLTALAIDGDGWLHTGDICSMDARGYFSVRGRMSDIIIRGGENIAAREIEDALFSHPSVAEAAVVGVPHHKWGEEILAFVRVTDGETTNADALEIYLRESLASFKIPRYWRFVDSFPLSAGGKIQKQVLRKEGAVYVAEVSEPS